MVRRAFLTTAVVVLAALGCSSADDAGEAPVDTSSPPDSAAQPTSTPSASSPVGQINEENGLVYLTDEEGSWTLNVASPDTDGPWPLIVVIPPGNGASPTVARELAERGAVVISPDSWAPAEAWASDPAPHLYGVMDRAACAVSWAQAHAHEYGANPELTTITGYSGGAMAAAWVGLGLADDNQCDDPIAHLPVALVPGESQFLFHHERWDPDFESGDPEPIATLDGLINPDRWEVSPDLRVALWSATNPIAETRAVENPPGDDSWVWIREGASPHVDDLAAVGAFDDERIDWADNARLMELRMQDAGIDATNEVYDIGHAYTDEVYDLIFSIQPATVAPTASADAAPTSDAAATSDVEESTTAAADTAPPATAPLDDAVFSFATDDLCQWVTEDDVAEMVSAVYPWEGSAELEQPVVENGPCTWSLTGADRTGYLYADGGGPYDFAVDIAAPLAAEPAVEYSEVGQANTWPFAVSGHPELSEGVLAHAAGFGVVEFWVPPREEYLSITLLRPDQDPFTGEDRTFLVAEAFLRELGWVPANT